MINQVPVNNFSFIGNEKKYLNECIETGWVSSEGPFIERFETEFSQYIGRSYGIAVANGSAALDIAIKVLGIGAGDEVIMPAFTIISPAFSVVKAGAMPVLVDSNLDTWNMNVDQIEAKITDRTKAIVVVHIYGLPAEMNEIIILAKKYNLKIIEDAAEMHGQTYFKKKCGSFGDISVFSFYANKLINTGEGGMILCDDVLLAKKCKTLKNLAFEPNGPRFVHYELGWNYRMTNMQAALGVAQLEQIDSFIEKKRSIGRYYNDTLAFLAERGFQLPLPSAPYAENIYWVYGLVAPSVEEKSRLLSFLSEKKIGHRPFFWCMHQQPVFGSLQLFQHEKYINAEILSKRGFYIPSGLGLTSEELEFVSQTFIKFYQ